MYIRVYAKIALIRKLITEKENIVALKISQNY